MSSEPPRAACAGGGSAFDAGCLRRTGSLKPRSIIVEMWVDQAMLSPA